MVSKIIVIKEEGVMKDHVMRMFSTVISGPEKSCPHGALSLSLRRTVQLQRKLRMRDGCVPRWRRQPFREQLAIPVVLVIRNRLCVALQAPEFQSCLAASIGMVLRARLPPNQLGKLPHQCSLIRGNSKLLSLILNVPPFMRDPV